MSQPLPDDAEHPGADTSLDVEYVSKLAKLGCGLDQQISKTELKNFKQNENLRDQV